MKLRSGSYKAFVPDHYPLGYILVAYGNAMYGNDFWRKVSNDAVKFKGLFYPFNRAIQKISGKSYRSFREDAIAFFKEKSFATQPKNASPDFITATEKNNVTDYLNPIYIGHDSILASKRSYRDVDAFYLLIKGKEKKIRIKNAVLDDYFSYNNGRIVYASFQSDPRWANRDYSVLQVIDIKTGKQKQLTHRSKYFSPDINRNGTEILCVEVNPDGTNFLYRLNANNGAVIARIPNPQNYFYTQTKYIDSFTAVSAARNDTGAIALVEVNLITGKTETITDFTTTVVGYPYLKGNTVYFNAIDSNADRIFAVDIKTKKLTRLTHNSNGIYFPSVNEQNELLASAFTAEGYRLTKINLDASAPEPMPGNMLTKIAGLYTPSALEGRGARALYHLNDAKKIATRYKKSSGLFNFHSRRPVVAAPEYGYTFYSDNILNTFSNELTYTYNRNEESHSLAVNAVYGGWYPVISIGAEATSHRSIYDRVIDSNNLTTFNSAKLAARLSLPLSFTGGRTNKYINAAVGYNAEQLYYRGIKQNIFANKALHYGSASLSLTNVSRQAVEHVNPHWAQAISATYRKAFNFGNFHKLVSNNNFYFPGFSKNHSILLQASVQQRDSFRNDLFSNTFVYSRGYEALSGRKMYKAGINYQLPLLYPDVGFANIVFFQRVRANAFFDYSSVDIRLSTAPALTRIINRSTGAEIFLIPKPGMRCR